MEGWTCRRAAIGIGIEIRKEGSRMRKDQKTYRRKPGQPGKAPRKSVYSRLDRIPAGEARKVITPGCLCLEGGAFRGLYTSGVLDVLMMNDINFETTIGVSAGALNALSYVAGQIGLSARMNLRYRRDPRYVGIGPMMSRQNQGVIGFDFLFSQMERTEPLNRERLMQPERRMIAVATALTTGWPVYFEKKQNLDELLMAVRASASMPFVSRPVNVCGIRCLDGGCSVKIPFEWALPRFEKIVVVRTRDRSFRPSLHDNSKIIHQLYGDFPEFEDVLLRMNETYIRELKEVDRLHEEGRIFEIVPSIPIRISRLEKDVEKLGDVYWQGVHDAKEQLPALREYLSAGHPAGTV